MAYEIPQNLKYSEKIVFNLTAKQFGYVALFVLIALGIFLRAPFAFEIKIALCLLSIGIGAGFAFLHFDEQLLKYWRYYRGIREAGYLDPKLSSFIPVHHVEQDIIYLKDGSMRSVIEIKPFNFGMLAKNEQLAIITQFKAFLHAIDFPIQILVRTTDLDLKDYFSTLRKQVSQSKNTKLLNQFEDFEKFVENYIQKQTIQNRLFYLVIPYDAPKTASNLLDFLKPITERKHGEFDRLTLEHRVKVVQEKLKKCNLLSKKLKDNELVGLLSGFFDSYAKMGENYTNSLTLLKTSTS